MKIKTFEEGTTVIKKGMVDNDTDLIIFPHSLKEIEDGACLIDDHTPYSYFYYGTLDDWKKVKLGDNHNICCINFISGRDILKL